MEKQLMASTTTLWNKLEDDMIHKGNHLDSYKAVMHSRQMIKQQSQSQGINAGKIHFDKLTKKEDASKPVLGKILKNKAHFSHVIFTPNTGPTSDTVSDDFEMETSKITSNEKVPPSQNPIFLKKKKPNI